MQRDFVFDLTLAYINQQDISSLSPAETVDKFEQIYDAMKNRYHERRESERQSSL